ncbi:MAG: hypothetical protein EON54_10240 [Alcaligenaceae bacterium]|nr:MAG: hypothetical protein EON54_10240 [Alcaligenaceae bacterium]
MLQIITNAIKNRQVLSLSYNGIQREVEPHAVGASRQGNDVLRCYQIAGGHMTGGHDWDLLTVAKIGNLGLTGQSFVGTRPGYSRGDKGMTAIYAEL